jgi:hypothetical protein
LTVFVDDRDATNALFAAPALIVELDAFDVECDGFTLCDELWTRRGLLGPASVAMSIPLATV